MSKYFKVEKIVTQKSYILVKADSKEDAIITLLENNIVNWDGVEYDTGDPEVTSLFVHDVDATNGFDDYTPVVTASNQISLFGDIDAI
jgi:hypothetical protein